MPDTVSEKDNSSRWLFAACSISAGISYFVIGLTHFLLPREQLQFASGVTRAFFESLASNSTAFVVHYIAFVCASLLGVGIVVGVYGLLESKGFWLRLTSVLGVVGFAVTALNFGFLMFQALGLASRFQGLDAAAQNAVLAIGLLSLDAYSLMGFGLVGLWFISVNRGLRQNGLLPRTLALLGAACGVLSESVFLGRVLHTKLLIDIAAAGAIVLIPVWFIWFGVSLLSGSIREQAFAQVIRPEHT